jgi:hypothetical protein
MELIEGELKHSALDPNNPMSTTRTRHKPELFDNKVNMTPVSPNFISRVWADGTHTENGHPPGGKPKPGAKEICDELWRDPGIGAESVADTVATTGLDGVAQGDNFMRWTTLLQ